VPTDSTARASGLAGRMSDIREEIKRLTYNQQLRILCGKLGGQAKVTKGIGTLSPERRKEMSLAANIAKQKKKEWREMKRAKADALLVKVLASMVATISMNKKHRLRQAGEGLLLKYLDTKKRDVMAVIESEDK